MPKEETDMPDDIDDRIYDVMMDEYHYNTIFAFGDLQDVVDRILANYVANPTLLDSLPSPGQRTACRHYYIPVTNQDYLAMTANKPTHSSYLSLRRILYDFVDNERWADFGMTPVDTTTTTEDAKTYSDDSISKLICKARSSIRGLYRTVKHIDSKKELIQIHGMLKRIHSRELIRRSKTDERT